jgi:guanyl-specific ribonuclease Sa
MALEMDGEQLASMSLRLTQTTVRQATDAYSAVAQEGGQAASAVNGSLVDYAQSLLDALRSAQELADNARSTLDDLLKGGFSLDDRFDAARLEKAQSFNSQLLDGLQSLLQLPAADQTAAA